MVFFVLFVCFTTILLVTAASPSLLFNIKTLMGKKRFRIFDEIVVWTIGVPHVSNVHLCRHPFAQSHWSTKLLMKKRLPKLQLICFCVLEQTGKFIPTHCLFFLSVKCLGQLIQSVFSPNLCIKLMESDHIEISFMKFLPHQLIGVELLSAERAGKQRTSSPKTLAKSGAWSGGDNARVSWAYSEQASVRGSY